MPQSSQSNAKDILFATSDLDEVKAAALVADSLKNCDDGELYVEYSVSESLLRDDGVLKSASFDISHGFGLRAVAGELTAFAHADEISAAAVSRAATTVSGVVAGYEGTWAQKPVHKGKPLYPVQNPIDSVSFEAKVKLLQEIETYVRDKEKAVKQVSIGLSGSWQVVGIIRPDGFFASDIRPLARIDVSVVLDNGTVMESGHDGWGGRHDYADFIKTANWQASCDEALRQARVMLEARPAPAGEMDVVLAGGWPGVMLHEAVGHGLEGDFHRKQSSVFTGMVGQRVASEGVTVVDDGTIEGRRGSITVDDEGHTSQRNVLIENGILVGLMQDRLNARLMGVSPTGNGRRESYAHKPMPRMTNTFMLGGEYEQAEIIASVKRGIFAPHFGGGQVDITSGQFVFSASEAYMIEDGKVTYPIKGATLIGKGADALTRVSMLGNDMALDNGIGTCGKDGQGVPVGVGQPSLKMRGITIGGTEA